jgi:hypothetical protein
MSDTPHEEENRPWWGGRASNPVGGAMRSRVGSTPILFRHDFPAVSLPWQRHAQPVQSGVIPSPVRRGSVREKRPWIDANFSTFLH